MTDKDTRYRILAAAAERFVAKGFRSTTVREICREAGANVAAVNYHFGDKKALYRAVIQHAIDQKPEYEVDPAASCEEQIRGWVKVMVFHCVAEDGELLSQLMANEMSQPTEFLAFISEQMIQPRVAQLTGIIAQELGRELLDPEVAYLAMSVVGQAVLYNQSRPLIEMMMPHMDYSEQKLNDLVEHITRCSMGMLEAFREKEK